MWDHVMHKGYATRLAVSFGDARDQPVRRSKERHPITADEHVRSRFAELMTDTDPVKRIAGIQLPTDSKSDRGLLCRILRLAREEK